MNERRAGSAATELWGLMRTAAFRLFARALEGFEASRGGRPTTLAAVRSEHLATFPDAGPREEGTAADTAPAPDVRRTVMRGGRRYNLDTARIGRGRSTPKPARSTSPNRGRRGAERREPNNI